MGDTPVVSFEGDEDKARVVVTAERLRTDDRSAFARALKDAAESKAPVVEVDLTRTGFMYSLFVGVLLDGVKRGHEAGKKVEILAGGSLYNLLKELGIGGAATLKETGG